MTNLLRRFYDFIVSPPILAISTVGGFVLAIYFGWFYSKPTEVTFDLTSDNYVVEIHEKLAKLDILYDGKNLKELNQALRIVTIGIQNSGGNTIRLGDYDPGEPLGLSISHGEILEARLSSTSDYIARHLSFKTSKSAVLFSPVILEPNESFIVTLLVVVTEVMPPQIVPRGKIAGAAFGQLKVVNSIGAAPKLSLGERALSFGFEVLRGISYFLAFLVSMTLLSIPSEIRRYKKDKMVRSERVGLVNRYIADHRKTFDKCAEFIFTVFADQRLDDPDQVFPVVMWSASLASLQFGTRIRHALVSEGSDEAFVDLVFKAITPRQTWKEIESKAGVESMATPPERVGRIMDELNSFLAYLKSVEYDHSRRRGPIMFDVSIIDLNAYKTPVQFNWIAS